MAYRIIIRDQNVKIIADDPTILKDMIAVQEAKRFASVEMMATDGQVKWIVKKGDQVFGPFETKEEALKFELGLEADD